MISSFYCNNCCYYRCCCCRHYCCIHSFHLQIDNNCCSYSCRLWDEDNGASCDLSFCNSRMPQRDYIFLGCAARKMLRSYSTAENNSISRPPETHTIPPSTSRLGTLWNSRQPWGRAHCRAAPKWGRGQNGLESNQDFCRSQRTGINHSSLALLSCCLSSQDNYTWWESASCRHRSQRDVVCTVGFSC